MDALIPWEEAGGRDCIRLLPAPRPRSAALPVGGDVAGGIACSSFTIAATRGWKMICMKWNRCGALQGLRLGGKRFRTETTILHFRHLLERHALGEMLLSRINQHLAARGLRLRQGTVVDSTLSRGPLLDPE